MGWIGILAMLALSISAGGAEACVIRDSSGRESSFQGDVLFALLKGQARCPQTLTSFRSVLTQAGLKTQPYLVANRGMHNRASGSFSFFEEVSSARPAPGFKVERGQFFFGHFTRSDGGKVVLDQEPEKGKLMIELIVWDPSKGMYNFYELIGLSHQNSQWFYRGDSKDALADNEKIYLGSDSPRFGSRMRCSACHGSGGPIMKELKPPHNDWWTVQRPVLFAGAVSSEVSELRKNLADASELSHSVQAGIKELEQSPRFQAIKRASSLKSRLRPLFCEMEINLESDRMPLERKLPAVQLPSGFIVSPLLAEASVEMDKASYVWLLKEFSMVFPETNRRDADHGWLTPVKGHSDLLAIQTLQDEGVVSEEFVMDVLAIDFWNPIFSEIRCGLLALFPEDGDLSEFVRELGSSSQPGAMELRENLIDPKRNKEFHRHRALRLLSQTQIQLQSEAGQRRLFEKLLRNRLAVYASQISQNPRGQILEPGFRVIFPVPARPLRSAQ